MAKFVYKFQSILNIKRQIEDMEKMNLGNLMKQLVSEEETLAEIQVEEQRFIDDFYEQNGKVVKARDLIDLNHTIKFYTNRKKEQMGIVEKKKEEVIKQREVLQKAVIERKSYEKLKEKAIEQYSIEEIKLDNQIVDEVVSYKYGQ